LCIVSGFEDDLSADQRVVAEQIVAGYTDKESANNLGLNIAALRMMKAEVRSKQWSISCERGRAEILSAFLYVDEGV